MSKQPLTSHQLASKLMRMPNLPISEHEHGEILVDVKVEPVSTNRSAQTGNPESCVSLYFE